VNIYSLSVLLFSFGVLLIAILSLSKRKDTIAIRFAVFSVGVCGWGFLYSAWTSQPYAYDTLLFLARLSEVFAVFIPISWMNFMLEFIGKKEPVRHFYAFNYAIAAVLSFFCFSPLFIKGMHVVPVFHWYKSPGPLFYVFLVYFFSLVIYAFYELIKAYWNSTGQTRSQLSYFLMGWSVAYAAGVCTFLPAFKITTFLPVLLLMPTYPIFVGISLIRYGLFDTEKIIDAFQREKLAAIGTMAASLNHELRNPLFIAKGKAETQLDAIERGVSTDEKNRTAIETIHKQLVRAMDIMERFSSFAKQKSHDKKENVVVKEVLDDVLHMVSSEFEMAKIKVVQHPTNGMSVIANRRQLEEIFFNLVINACHSMEQKGGELRLNAYQPNGKVIVEIEDTGSGIPKQNQKKIFEPFYSTKSEKGSGLGLYITKQLVERNGGKISVKSKSGEGAKFTLTLPACPAGGPACPPSLRQAK
jgi:signal transduction histidine kinase